MAEGIELATLNTRYYCYHCSREVSPIHTTELTCPDCSSGFLEEVSRDIFDVQDMLRPDYFSMFNLAFENFTNPSLLNIRDDLPEEPDEQSDESTDVQPDESTDEQPSYHEILLGLEDHVDEQLMRYRYLEDYIFENELDILATRFLNEADISGSPPLPKEQIKQLPMIAVIKEHIEKGIQCTICMDDFKLREKAKCLPCEHFYHEKCITPWLERHSTCPNCRKIVNMQSRSRRSRSCPRSSLNSSNSDGRRFSDSTSFSDFFTTSLNPFRLL